MNSNLERLKQKFREQREISAKPFPLHHLLALYEISSRQDTYINYMEGFTLLANWLSPIEIPIQETPIPKLHHTYDIQEIARILNTKQEIIYHASIRSSP